MAESALHGRGVFAARPFQPDELVESCPVIVIPPRQHVLLDQTTLHGLVFTWHGNSVGLAFGFGSFYNHSWRPNAWYETDHDDRVVRFYAARPIRKGAEVTINYLGHPDERGELWFDAGPPPET